MKKCKANVDDGYAYVVDMGLEKFFDTVCHSKLMEVISRTIRDGRVLSLIHKYLNAGAMVKGSFERTEVGTPQGGPLSPLLSNIMLNELDRELERRGLRFVRYADDCMIFCRSRKAAERALAHILPFIEGKLFLKVNRQNMSKRDRIYVRSSCSAILALNAARVSPACADAMSAPKYPLDGSRSSLQGNYRQRLAERC